MKGHGAEITQLEFNGLLYSSDVLGELRVSDVMQEKVILGLKTDSEISSFGIIEKSVLIASGKVLRLYDTRGKIVITQPDLTWDCSDDDINQISIHKNQNFIGIAQDQGYVLIMDLRNRSSFKKLKLHSNLASCVQFRPNHSWHILSGGFDEKAFVSDFSRGSKLSEFTQIASGQMQINAPFVSGCTFDKSGKIILVGRYNGNLELHRSLSSSKKKEEWESNSIQGHRWAINSVRFDQDDFIVSTGLDGNVSLWDKSLNKISDVEFPGQKFNSVAVINSASSKITVAVGGFNLGNQGKIFIHDLEKK